jgi:hypothetical protein
VGELLYSLVTYSHPTQPSSATLPETVNGWCISPYITDNCRSVPESSVGGGNQVTDFYHS